MRQGDKIGFIEAGILEDIIKELSSGNNSCLTIAQKEWHPEIRIVTGYVL